MCEWPCLIEINTHNKESMIYNIYKETNHSYKSNKTYMHMHTIYNNISKVMKITIHIVLNNTPHQAK